MKMSTVEDYIRSGECYDSRIYTVTPNILVGDHSSVRTPANVIFRYLGVDGSKNVLWSGFLLRSLKRLPGVAYRPINQPLGFILGMITEIKTSINTDGIDMGRASAQNLNDCLVELGVSPWFSDQNLDNPIEMGCKIGMFGHRYVHYLDDQIYTDDSLNRVVMRQMKLGGIIVDSRAHQTPCFV